MNRFPKMMILWGVYFKEKGFDDFTAAALGHAAATMFAIMKNRRWGGGKSSKKGKFTKGGENSQTAPSLKEGWEWVDEPSLPFKGVWIKRTREGVIYRLKDREVNGTQEYIKQVEKKFAGRDQYMAYIEFAKAIVKQLEGRWKSKWYKAWKEIRDLDWDKAMPVIGGGENQQVLSA